VRRRTSPLVSAVSSCVFVLIPVAILGFVNATPASASTSLETFALAVGGISFSPMGGCTTFGIPTPVSDFFEIVGLGLPTDGLVTCGVAGGFNDKMSPTGPLSDDRSLSSAWNASTFSGSTMSAVNYGGFTAQAHGEFSGDFASRNVTGTESFGIACDDFTFSTPSFANGQPGTVVFRTTVTGGLSTTATGTAGVRLDYHVNAGPRYSMLSSSVDYSTLLPSLVSVGATGLAGFVRTPGAMSGSGEVSSAAIPIVFGTAFEFKLGLFAYAAPGLTSIVDSDFQATITGIEVRGPGGVLVTDFSITSSSGTPYAGSGVTAVNDSKPDDPGNRIRLTASPNPARGRVELGLGAQARGVRGIEIYDLAGRLVRQLIDLHPGDGDRSVSWDGTNDQGVSVPSGVYFARAVGERMDATRITLVR